MQTGTASMASPPENNPDFLQNLITGGGLLGLLGWWNERRKIRQQERKDKETTNAALAAAKVESDRVYFIDVEKRVDWALNEAKSIRESVEGEKTFYQLQINELNSKMDAHQLASQERIEAIRREARAEVKAIQDQAHAKELQHKDDVTRWMEKFMQQEINHRDIELGWTKENASLKEQIRILAAKVEKLEPPGSGIGAGI
jgi:hypothetical protein